MQDENKSITSYATKFRGLFNVEKTQIIHYVLLSIILASSGYLIFKNLGDAALWDDESETAIVARNFLKTGHFTDWDGRNLIGTRNGTYSYLDKNLTNRIPPLPSLVTAISFSMLGESNLSARLPFAIIGLFTVLLIYLLLRTEFPEKHIAALYATAFIGLSTEYILYVYPFG